MSILTELFVGLALLGAVVLISATLGFFVVRHKVRRYWRRVQAHGAARSGFAALSLLAAWRERFGGRRTSASLGRSTPARARRTMWVAIGDAEDAVRHAEAFGAPVAELPAVCRSLRQVGGELEQLVRLGRGLSESRGISDGLRTQMAELIRAARDVQAAALSACGDTTEPRVRSLVRDAGDEVQIVATALARLRSITLL
jgi:hypothetical protein